MKQGEDENRAKLRLLEVINEFQANFIDRDDLEAGFKKLTRRVLELTHSEYGFISELRQSPTGDPYLHILAYAHISNDPSVQKFFDEQGRGGLEFFNLNTLFGSVVTSGEMVIANQPATDSRSGGLPEGHPELRAFAGLPLYQGQEFLGVLCLANRPEGYSEDLAETLQPLLNACGHILLIMKHIKKRKEAEARLKKQTNYLRLLQGVALAASEAPTFDQAMQASLKQICETLDCALGVVHKVDDSRTCLVPAGIVYQNVPDLAFSSMSKSLHALFAKGEGLAGRVWERAQPEWLSNIRRDKTLLKRLEEPENGPPHSGFAFPVFMRNDLHWVLQFFTPDVREPDPELLDILVSAGSQLGPILERKQLTQNQAMWSAIMKSTNDAIIGKDLDGTIISWNYGAEKIFGYLAEEVMGRNVTMLFPAEQKDDALHILEGIRNGDTLKMETRGLNKEGETLDLALTLSPTIDADGERIGSSTIAWDTTEKKRAEKELVQTRIEAQAANRAKSEFLAHMSHEVHTPLNSVLGFAQILVSDPQLSTQHKDYVSRILEGGTQLMNLMDDILEMSKIDVGNVELHNQTFDLWEMVARIAVSIRNRCLAKDLEFRMEGIEGKALWVQGDEPKLHIALIHILSNAVKFTHRGTVTLRVTQKPEDVFLFEIIDTGQGIPREKQDKIFDAFEKLGQVGITRGMGLGLSISKKHIEAMGGSIRFESVPDEGTRFAVEIGLPRVGDSAFQRQKDWRFKKPLAWKGLDAGLVGHFDQENFRDLTTLLESLGLAWKQVEGIDSTRLLENPPSNMLFFDLDDLHVKGQELIRKLRKFSTYSGIPIFVLVSPDLRELALQCKEVGADLVLVKPVQTEAVIKAVQKVANQDLGFLKSLALGRPVNKKREIDLERITLAEPVLEAMKASASSYNFTSFEKNLQTVGTQGEEGEKLALFFKDLIRSYDMKQINQVLDFIQEVRKHRKLQQ